jgi:enoyl-CoA hydratase
MSPPFGSPSVGYVAVMSDAPPSDAVVYALDGDVAVVSFDDGKVNVLTHAVIDALSAAVAKAGAEARAVAVIGREGRFCAGFDLTVMRAGPAEAGALLTAGARLALDIYLSPVPVVLGCTGHALAMGGILLMSADTRIGADGPFKLGMNEVAIGMPMPRFAAALARDRLAPTHLNAAIQLARIWDPAGAVAAGFLDEAHPAAEVRDRAIAHARELAATLDPNAFRITRSVLRGPSHETISQALQQDGRALQIGQV